MYPHRIRLRGPWECEPLTSASAEPLAAAKRVIMPGSMRTCGLGAFSGGVLFRRRFGYPGRIDSHERVWLTFERIDGNSEIRLNDTPLGGGAAGSFEFDVTTLLQPRNRLEVVIEADADGGLVGEVAMEVRCTAFLKNVHLLERTEPRRWQLVGDLIGTCDRPLELYAVTDQGTIAYRTIDTRPDGQHFAIDIADPPEGITGARIELINVSTVWYAVDVQLENVEGRS